MVLCKNDCSEQTSRSLEVEMLRFLKPLITVTLLMIVTAHGFAQRNRLGFFINMAGYFPSEDNIKSGYGSGLGAVFFVNQNVSLSLEWKYGRYGVEKKEGEFLSGTLYITPLLASIHYNFQTGTSFSPYVFAGGGLFFSTIGLDERQTSEDKNVRKQEIKNGLGLYGGIGSTIRLNDWLYLFVEGLYLRRKADIDTIYLDNSPATTFKANLSAFSVLFGLDYFY